MEEVLVEGARAAADRGDLAQFEALMIRANRPRDVVQHYKELGNYPYNTKNLFLTYFTFT